MLPCPLIFLLNFYLIPPDSSGTSSGDITPLAQYLHCFPTEGRIKSVLFFFLNRVTSTYFSNHLFLSTALHTFYFPNELNFFIYGILLKVLCFTFISYIKSIFISYHFNSFIHSPIPFNGYLMNILWPSPQQGTWHRKITSHHLLLQGGKGGKELQYDKTG